MRKHCLRRDESGATAVEYALLISLLAMAGWSAFSFTGSKISATFDNASAAMPAAPSSSSSSSSSSSGGGHHDDD